MKLLRKTKWVIAMILVVAISFFATGTALANYLGSGYFGTNQMYRCHTGSYATENQNASAKWSATTDLDNYYSCNGNNISTYGNNYGSTTWVALATICDIYGHCYPNDTSVFDNTYASCSVQENTYWLDSWTSTERQFAATHELGHCWSLAHDSRSTSVMQNARLSIVDPDATNISEVNARY